MCIFLKKRSNIDTSFIDQGVVYFENYKIEYARIKLHCDLLLCIFLFFIMHYKSKNSVLKHLDFLAIDVIVISISFLLANLTRFHKLNYYPNDLFYSVLMMIVFSMVLINVVFNPYSGILRRDNVDEYRINLGYTIYYLLAYIIVSFLFKMGGLYSRIVVILTYIYFHLFGFLIKTMWKKLIIAGKIPFIVPERIPLLIVVKRNDVEAILENIDQSVFHRYDIKAICVADSNTCETKICGYDCFAGTDCIHNYVIQNNIREVFFYLNPEKINNNMAKNLVDEGVGVQLNIQSIFGFETDNQIIDKVGIYHTLGLGLFVFTPAQVFYLWIKRFLDIVFSLAACVFMLLLIVVVKLANVSIGDHSSIFYTQRRVGKDGKIFNLYKFRSMVPDADEKLKELLKDEKLSREWEEYHKLASDPRITPIGSFLRRSSLDEFPQFINVLKGDMSLVGPRPLTEGELEMHNGLKLYERVKPGITGWWACNGRSNISYKERLELEYYYVKNCSFFLDVLTILRTLACVLKKTGAE